jgi:hypothetical protein
MEDDSERMAMSRAQLADAVAELEPRAPCTGRLLTANTTASPCLSGTTIARDCIRGRCWVSTNSPPSKSSPGSLIRTPTWRGKTCSP